MGYLQHIVGAITISSAILTFPVEAVADNEAVKPDSGDRVARVESDLPAMTQGDRTLRLSLMQWMEVLAVPGVSIVVIDDHRIAWAKAYGVTTPGPQGSLVTQDTIFQAASIAKPVVALAVLNQVERGRFDLDADINDYLLSWELPGSELQAGEKVTIRRLLAHTGGITPGGFPGYARTASVPGVVQVLGGEAPATNSPARVVSKPGSEVAYSGLGYSMLQLALEDQLDKSFESILQETLLRPLGLDDSTFEQNLPEPLQARAARGHRGSGDAIEGGWLLYPEMAAAGFWTTPTDLAKLLLEVADAKRDGGDHLLSSEMTRQMLSPHRDEMGLGFVVRDSDAHGYFAHSGGNQGYFAHFEMLADSGKGVVVMTNSDAGQALASLVIASVANEYDWPLLDRRQVSAARVQRIFAQVDRATNKRVKVEVDPELLARYVGKYELEPGLVFDITLVETQLLVRLGDQPRFPLFPESESKFFLQAVDAQITFIVDTAGQATGLVLHQGGRDQQARKIE
ncbi:MAG: serine hydrolase [Pseudomonadota bacterium]|nr:serine hydrolase [Pseudomonadota bacterium]